MQENLPGSVLPVHIMIVDDHAIFRDGLKVMFAKLNPLGIHIVDEASNGLEALKVLEKVQPHIILMDVEMPVLNGIAATDMIFKKYPHIAVIALSSFDDVFHLDDMICAGAKGYILKNTSKEEMVTAIQTVMAGNHFYTPVLAPKLEVIKQQKEAEEKSRSLTVREKEIVSLLCQGKSNKEIAKSLFISKRTVETHRNNIMLKLHANHPADIMTYALRHKIYKL